MKFTCEQYLINAAVTTAGRAAASKSPVPALEGLLLEADASGVRVTGFDLQKGIYTTLPADVAEAGSIVLPAKLLGDIVRKMPDGIVTFSSDENGMVVITCLDAEFNLAGIPAEDYPEMPSLDHTGTVTILQKTFADMIAQTGFAISSMENRPVYTGALIEVEEGRMTMVAVDGYRLAMRKENVDSCDVDAVRVIVPGSALRDLEKICTSADDSMTIRVGSKHVGFTVGETVLITRRLEGEFLNYKKTVPFEFPIRLTGVRAELIRSIDRVSLIIDDRTKNPLRCVFGENRLFITCSTPRGRAEDVCKLEGDGGSLTVGFNNAYLMDALKAAPDENVHINLISSASPCVITPEDDSDRYLYMILPVRLRAE